MEKYIFYIYIMSTKRNRNNHKGTYQRPTKFIRKKSNRTRKLKNYL